MVDHHAGRTVGTHREPLRPRLDEVVDERVEHLARLVLDVVEVAQHGRRDASEDVPLGVDLVVVVGPDLDPVGHVEWAQTEPPAERTPLVRLVVGLDHGHVPQPTGRSHRGSPVLAGHK
jgi:hypothetical protein